MPIRFLELGLIGRADAVELYLLENGTWQLFPVKYKHGRPKRRSPCGGVD